MTFIGFFINECLDKNELPKRLVEFCFFVTYVTFSLFWIYLNLQWMLDGHNGCCVFPVFQCFSRRCLIIFSLIGMYVIKALNDMLHLLCF